jgi:myo-inositol-1(or 4)-monophosphatase
MSEPTSGAVVEPEALLRLAVAVATEAAELIATERRSAVEVADTKSSATDIVTRVDRASEELIRSRLLGERPDDGFVGEEGSDDQGTSGVRWVVDPIDGTVNFLYGLPRYAVCIAAEVDGEVVAGVVLDVPSRTCYTATLGGGAFRDGEPISVRGPVPLEQRLVITGFSYVPEIRSVQARAIARLLPRVRDVRRIGSSALDVCHVAEGSADAYVEEGLHPWDYYASGLIAREAGARTLVGTGAGGGMRLLVCAPAHGFDDFLTLVTEVGLCVDSGE